MTKLSKAPLLALEVEVYNFDRYLSSTFNSRRGAKKNQQQVESDMTLLMVQIVQCSKNHCGPYLEILPIRAQTGSIPK